MLIGAQQFDAAGNVLLGEGLVEFERNGTLAELSDSLGNSVRFTGDDVGSFLFESNFGEDLEVTVLPSESLSLALFAPDQSEPPVYIYNPSRDSRRMCFDSK